MAENKTKSIETEAVEMKTVESSVKPSTEGVERHIDLYYIPSLGVTVKSREEADKLLKENKESDNG